MSQKQLSLQDIASLTRKKYPCIESPYLFWEL